MLEKLMKVDLQAIIDAYVFKSEEAVYQCLICGESFEEGRIYDVDGKLYEAFKAVALHVQEA